MAGKGPGPEAGQEAGPAQTHEHEAEHFAPPAEGTFEDDEEYAVDEDAAAPLDPDQEIKS